MTPQQHIKQLAQQTKAHIERLRAAHQGGHADALRAAMWEILGPYLAKSSGH